MTFEITNAPGGGLGARMVSVDQGSTAIPASAVKIEGGRVRVALDSIQAVYEGVLDSPGAKMTGEWRQGQLKLPLILEKGVAGAAGAEAEVLAPGDVPSNQAAAAKVAGRWEGSLAGGAAELHVVVRISKSAAGAATGFLDSPDQGASDIPIRAVLLKEGKLRFTVPGVGGAFQGALSSDGATLEGEWRQLGQTTPLVLKKKQDR